MASEAERAGEGEREKKDADQSKKKIEKADKQFRTSWNALRRPVGKMIG